MALLASQRPSQDKEQKKNNHLGSAKLRHRNLKVKAWKSTHAATRALTDDEHKRLVDSADREWARIEADPAMLAIWRGFKATNAKPKRQRLQQDQPAPEWAPLWGQEPGHATHPINLESLAAYGGNADCDDGAAAERRRKRDVISIDRPRCQESCTPP